MHALILPEFIIPLEINFTSSMECEMKLVELVTPSMASEFVCSQAILN